MSLEERLQKLASEPRRLLTYDMIAIGVVSKIYPGPYHEFVRGYVHDVTYPIAASLALGKRGVRLFQNPLAHAAEVFLGCCAVEYAQKLGLWPGTYDEKDFWAYGIGVTLSLGLDVLLGMTERLQEKRKAALCQTSSCLAVSASAAEDMPLVPRGQDENRPA